MSRYQPGPPFSHDDEVLQALFIGQTYIDVTFITDHMPTGDEKHVASAYAVSFGGNAVTAASAAPSSESCRT